jgi:hypothetical protein
MADEVDAWCALQEEERHIAEAENAILGPVLRAGDCPRGQYHLMLSETVRLLELAEWLVVHRFLSPREFEVSRGFKQVLCIALAQALNRYLEWRWNDTHPDRDAVDWTSDEAVAAHRRKVKRQGEEDYGADG